MIEDEILFVSFLFWFHVKYKSDDGLRSCIGFRGVFELTLAYVYKNDV